MGSPGTVEDVLALDPLHLWATSYDCAKRGGDRVADRRRRADVEPASRPAATRCSTGDARAVQFVDPLHGWVVLSSASGPVDHASRRRPTVARPGARSDARLPEPGDVMFYTPTDGYLGASPAGQFAYGTSALYVTHDAGRTWARVTIDFGEPGPAEPVMGRHLRRTDLRRQLDRRAADHGGQGQHGGGRVVGDDRRRARPGTCGRRSRSRPAGSTAHPRPRCRRC